VKLKKRFVVDDYALTVASYGDIECGNGVISNVYHVPILSANLLLIPQLIQTDKKV